MKNAQTVAIANDHAGFALKETLKRDMEASGLHVEDLGTHDTASVDYPDYAHALAAWMSKHPDSKGVLVCGSGIGMSIAANRHAHIRAALCSTAEAATLARQHNNANVLCLGARLVTEQAALACLGAFLTTEFEGGRHQARLSKLEPNA